MESISHLRQMMAEEKFFEVQRLIETEFSLQTKTHRHELISIYLDSLKAQKKAFPLQLRLELCELELEQHHDDVVIELLKDISSFEEKKHFLQIQKLKAHVFERKGLMNDLYLLVVQLLHFLFQHQIPKTPEWASLVSEKYFKHDFALNLHQLGLSLLSGNFKQSEKLTQDLILSCVEKSSPRGIKEKLSSIGEVLRSVAGKGKIDVYQNFIDISVSGVKEKTDYKKIVEMVILFDDFKFQTLLLDLFYRLGMKDFVHEYSQVVRNNPEYDFVYFDKYFQHLKGYFVQKLPKEESLEEKFSPDLKLEDEYVSEIFGSSMDFSESEEENRLILLLKHQQFTCSELCDLAVGFLQSELPKVALKASERALKESKNDQEYLKASYLKLTCLLQLKDYRAALDVCLSGLEKAKSKDDILSFMYSEAEVYMRLENYKQARMILKKVLTIDSDYRLAKERLEKLNEI